MSALHSDNLDPHKHFLYLYSKIITHAPTSRLLIMSEVNTSYLKWKEDYNITREWIGDFPTIDIYHNYVRYCMDNHYPLMEKKVFYHVLETDFNI